MIVFCEDCGAKNRLDPDQIRNDQIRNDQAGYNFVSFTCLTCQYKNAYKMDIPSNSQPDRYKNALKGILSASSIIGLFIFHEAKGIVDNFMPEVLKESDLLFLSKHLINAHQESIALFPDSDKTIWGIGNTHLTIKYLGNSFFIVLASNTSALPSHVNSQLDYLSDLLPNLSPNLSPSLSPSL